MKRNEIVDFDKIFTYTNLYNAYLLCRKGNRWKEMTQKFENCVCINVYKLYEKLHDEKWKHSGYHTFTKIERGKERFIQAEYFTDRVVERCLCEYSLFPTLSKSFIFDNGACQKYKGVDFAVNRCRDLLREHIRKYGNEGYVLQFDFHHYFEEIPRERVYEFLSKMYTDDRVMKVIHQFIDNFTRGLGLGSQISQTIGLYYPNRLDHKIKEYFRVRGYIRYMDDGVAFFKTKEEAQKVLDYLKEWCKENEIPLNEKKTHITKLTKGFSFLKRNFIALNNKVVVCLNKENIKRMKRKIKKLAKFMSYEGLMTYAKSWFGSISHQDCNSYRQLKSIERYIVKVLGDNYGNGR